MGMKCGIVGLPNVGKSTLFKTMTEAPAAIANYPFCTIDPNQSTVWVADPRLEELARVIQPRTVTPTSVEVVDIAGLVRGASEGEGLGNQFLAHIREVDALCQVIRCFEDSEVTHVHGRVDPISDLAVIETELALKDLETVTRRRDKIIKQVQHLKHGEAEVEVLHKIVKGLESGQPVRRMALEENEILLVRDLNLLTAKPQILVANVAEADLPEGGPHTAALKAFADAEGLPLIVICGQVECELSEIPASERRDYLDSLGLERPGKEVLIQAITRLLQLISFFTAGEKEVRAWTVPEGSPAPKAAGVIHSDFERGFISVETIAWQDLVALNGYGGARQAGKLRVEGKHYIIKDGDVCLFRFSV